MCFFPFVSIDALIAREREAEAERQRAKASAEPPQGASRKPAEKVADLVVGGLDMIGEEVTCFYGRRLPDYAVYRTKKRVGVQFADETARALDQRRKLAPLYPLRGEIDGLIDGWRLKDPSDHRFRRALRFDRRVGDALVVAFEEDVPDAAIILSRIKQDILDSRTAWARFEYMLAAFALGLVMIGIAHFAGQGAEKRGHLWAAAAAGGAGAFFSIAIGIRGRTVLPDLLWLANTMDAFLRMVIGMIGGAVLVAFMVLKLFSVKMSGTELISPTGDDLWLQILLAGFIAGFSERLVPDLLAKAAGKPDEPPQPRRDQVRQPAAGQAADAGAAEGDRKPATAAETGDTRPSQQAPAAPGAASAGQAPKPDKDSKIR